MRKITLRNEITISLNFLMVRLITLSLNFLWLKKNKH